MFRRSLGLFESSWQFWEPKCWNAQFLPLTWPWPDTWPFKKNFKSALEPSRRELSNAASPVSLRSLVWELAWGGVIRPPPPPGQWRSAETPVKRGLKEGCLENVLRLGCTALRQLGIWQTLAHPAYPNFPYNVRGMGGNCYLGRSSASLGSIMWCIGALHPTWAAYLGSGALLERRKALLTREANGHHYGGFPPWLGRQLPPRLTR